MAILRLTVIVHFFRSISSQASALISPWRSPVLTASNLQKAAFDALTKSGFWLDDQQVDYYCVKRMAMIKGGRLNLTITELEEA